jgi:hypothetical protein
MSNDNLEPADLDLALREARCMVQALEVLNGSATLELDAGSGQVLGHLGKGARRSLLMDVRRSARLVEASLRPRRVVVVRGASGVRVWRKGEVGA